MPQRAPLEVEVATPLRKEVVEWAEFTGRLEAVDFVEVRSRVSGYLQSVHFQDGQQVKHGDLLFVVDPRPFEAAVAKAKATLVESEAQSARSRSLVKAANAQKQKAAANLTVASRRFERAKSLTTRNTITQEEFDLRESDFLLAKADIEAADAAVAEANASIATANAAIETAKSLVDQSVLDLSYTKIAAPVAGRISRQNVTEGNLIGGGSEQSVVLTTIVSTDPVYFVFDASEQQVLRFQRMTLAGKRQSARDVQYPVYLELVDESNYPHQGYLDFVDNRFDPSTATMMARAVLTNPDGILTPGLFGKIRLAETAPFEGLLVPDSAIATDQADQLVYVVGQENKIESRRVETGSVANGLRIIHSGIQAEDRIVISGLQRIRPGVTVDPKSGEIVADDVGLTVEDAQTINPADDSLETNATDQDPSNDAQPPLDKN